MYNNKPCRTVKEINFILRVPVYAAPALCFLIIKTVALPMSDLYSNSTLKREATMKTPRPSTLNFLRNFARAYAAIPAVGTLILN